MSCAWFTGLLTFLQSRSVQKILPRSSLMKKKALRYSLDALVVFSCSCSYRTLWQKAQLSVQGNRCPSNLSNTSNYKHGIHGFFFWWITNSLTRRIHLHEVNSSICNLNQGKQKRNKTTRALSYNIPETSHTTFSYQHSTMPDPAPFRWNHWSAPEHSSRQRLEFGLQVGSCIG